MYLHSILTLALISLSTSTIINFDSVAVNGLMPSAITKVDHLQFQSFVVADVATPLRGISPHSPKNWASTGFRAQAGLNPDQLPPPSLIPVAKPANFTVKYTGSTVNTFDLLDFYLGCIVATGLTVFAIPVRCTVRLTALDGTGQAKGFHIATYTPLQECDFDFSFLCAVLGDKEEMGKIELGSAFLGVGTVLVELVSSSVVDQATFITGFDDLNVVYH